MPLGACVSLSADKKATSGATHVEQSFNTCYTTGHWGTHMRDHLVSDTVYLRVRLLNELEYGRTRGIVVI